MNETICYDALFMLIDPLKDQHRAALRKKAEQLKQSDGEGWAIGETIERICIFLDAHDIALKEELKKLEQPDGKVVKE